MQKKSIPKAFQHFYLKYLKKSICLSDSKAIKSNELNYNLQCKRVSLIYF